MTVLSVAHDHYRDRARLADAAEKAAVEAWRQVDPDRIDTWRQQLPELLVTVTGAQRAAANAADDYLDAVLGQQDIDSISVGQVQPQMVSGVASDGRDLATLLDQPRIAALAALAGDATAAEAMAVGLTQLRMIVRTQISDAGRAADTVAMTARPASGGYVRMLVGKSCPRCAILAGRWYRWSTGFTRHPRCDCIHIPSRESLAGDLTTDPRRLVETGRVTGLSKADREAIDVGADPAQVVNARRGMYVAGGKRFTRESTTKRGSAPRIRLMPDQILAEARGNRQEAIRLLRLHAYLR